MGITPRIAPGGTEHGSGLGVYRWVAEAAFAALLLQGRGPAGAVAERAVAALAVVLVGASRVATAAEQ